MLAHATPSPAVPEANDDGNILTMLRALESRIETAESMRKQDAQKIESWMKQDAQKIESWIEQDAQKIESWIEQDAQKIESWIEQDAQKIESWIKQDAQKTESWIKQDAQKVELLRKDVEREEEKDWAELESKIKQFEQNANDREDRWKERHKFTQQCLETLASDMDAINNFLAVGVRLSLFSPPFL